MKVRNVIEIKTEDYIEEQFILEKFPEALWFNYTGNIMFYLPNYLEDEVNKAVEYIERKKS